MVDILVRSIPETDATRIATNASRAGISRSEYIRRIIHDGVERATPPISTLAGSATGLFPDGILDELDAEWSDRASSTRTS